MPFREIFHWWNHSVSSGQLTSFFGDILLLNLNLSNFSMPRWEHCPCRLVQKAQHHLSLFILEQGESELLRPRDLLPWLRSLNLLPSKFKPVFLIKVFRTTQLFSRFSFLSIVCENTLPFTMIHSPVVYSLLLKTFHFQTFKRLAITIIEHFISNHTSFSRTLVLNYPSSP